MCFLTQVKMEFPVPTTPQNYLELVDSQPLPFPGAKDVNVSGREYTVTNLWEIMDTLENGYCLNAIIQPSI